jgi:hypothetical protein
MGERFTNSNEIRNRRDTRMDNEIRRTGVDDITRKLIARTAPFVKDRDLGYHIVR